MAFTVEDGTGLAAANSYGSVANFESYHDDRGNVHSSFSSTEKQQALIRASDHIDRSFRFVGDRLNSVQRLEWPRLSAFDRDQRLISGVPRQVEEATFEYAFRTLAAPLLPDPEVDATGSRVIRRSERVGPLSESVEYAADGAYKLPKYPNADRLLREFVRIGNRIVRG